MANDYDKTLEIFKQLQQTGATDASTMAPQHTQKPSQDRIMGDLSMLDEAVFGKYVPANGEVTPDGKSVLIETLKEIKSGNVSKETMDRVRENVENLKIPRSIIDSMIEQPLIQTDVNGVEVEDYMNTLLKGNKNIEASKRINQMLSEEKKPQAQPSQTKTVSTEIDYQKVRQIVEEVMDSKLSQIASKMSLNETRQTQVPAIKAIQEVSGGKFLLADTSDNVYECTMVYKGKNKRKN